MIPIVGELLGKLIKPVSDLLSEFITDKDKLNEITYKLSTLAATNAHEISMGQIEINKIEAGSRSLWVAGWRPGTGWVCTLALANNYVVVPYVSAFTSIDVPALDTGALLPLLGALLGFGGLRTHEKIKGITK